MRDVILGGTGFRTSTDAHREAERIFDREVVTLELVDPRFYHLDTALFALDRDQIAYSPATFSDSEPAHARASLSRHDSRRRARCACLRVQPMSDGNNVFLPAGADTLTAELNARGFTPVPIALPQLRKAGGSVKCCTLELREEPS